MRRKSCSSVSFSPDAWVPLPDYGGRLGFDSRAQFFERALGDQTSLMNDGDVAAQALHDFENVRGQEDRGAAGDHALQHRFQCAGGDCVHAFEGLVEKQNLGPVDHGGGEGQLLLHAVGIIGNEFFRLVGELHEFEQLGGALSCGGAVEAVHASGKAEELGAGEAAEQGHAFGHDPDLALDFDGMRVEIDAEDFDASGAGREQAGQHFDGGGFTRAIGAEEAEELSGGDAQVDVVNGYEFSEAAGQAFCRDGGCEVHRVFESSIPGERVRSGSEIGRGSPEAGSTPESDSAGGQQGEHRDRECTRPTQRNADVRKSCHGCENSEESCRAENEDPIENRSAGRAASVRAAFHAGADVFGFDVVALAFAVGGILPGGMFALGRRGERDRNCAEGHEDRASCDLHVDGLACAAQFMKDEDAPQQSPELVGVRERNASADADIFCGVLLEQISEDPDEAAQHQPEQNGSARRRVRARAGSRRDR